jgi:hypothetical protein
MKTRSCCGTSRDTGKHHGMFVLLAVFFGVFWLIYKVCAKAGYLKKDLYTFKYDYK